MMFAYIELCRKIIVDKMNAYFGTSRNIGAESGIRICRLKTQFAVIRFEAKHDGDRTNINIPGYDVNITFCHYEQIMEKTQERYKAYWKYDTPLDIITKRRVSWVGRVVSAK